MLVAGWSAIFDKKTLAETTGATLESPLQHEQDAGMAESS